MSGRATLPDALVTSTLTPSAEGLTIKQPTPAVTFTPPSQPVIAAKTVATPPPVVPPQKQPASQPVAQAVLQPPIPAVLSQPAVEVAAPAPIVASPQPVIQQMATEKKENEWGITINPLMVIFLILIFVVVFIILYVTKTNMVTDLVNGERVLNNSKLVFWTVLISITLAVVAFIVSAVFKRKSATTP